MPGYKAWLQRRAQLLLGSGCSFLVALRAAQRRHRPRGGYSTRLLGTSWVGMPAALLRPCRALSSAPHAGMTHPFHRLSIVRIISCPSGPFRRGSAHTQHRPGDPEDGQLPGEPGLFSADRAVLPPQGFPPAILGSQSWKL